MFLKTLTSTFNVPLPNYRSGWGAGFPIQESRVKKIAEWLQVKPHRFIFLRSIKWVPGTPVDWVIKSKLSPFSGLVALRKLNPIRKKEP